MYQNKRIAIIPTGEYQRGNINNLVKDLKSRYNLDLYICSNKDEKLINANEDNNIMEENIQKINWGYASTNSPELRAKILYNAIFKEEIDYIYITSGRGNKYTIIELDKIIKQNTENKLNKLPIVYGMSDTTNMLNYPGQRNIAKTFISASPLPPITDKSPRQTVKINSSRNDAIRSTNFNEQNELNGVLIPEYSLRSYRTLQEMKIFNDRINFLATELKFENEATLMIDFYKNIDFKDKNNIIFCLSAVGDQNNKSNQIKNKEQEKFKNWCLTNGFNVIEEIKFGHNNKNDQYLDILVYCECKLDTKNSKLTYSHNACKMSNENSKTLSILQQNDSNKYSSLMFNKNYIPGGASEVSVFVKKRDKEEKPLELTTIFSQAKNLKPNVNGEFSIEFDSFQEKKDSAFVYIQDLERVLKDIDKLKWMV